MTNLLGTAYDRSNKFSPRIRFNWGFHDGAAEAKRESLREVNAAFDYAYAAGYHFGANYALEGKDIETSTAAWIAFVKAWSQDTRQALLTAHMDAEYNNLPKKERTEYRKRIAETEAREQGLM